MRARVAPLAALAASFLPFAVSAASHLGCWPRPAQVCAGLAGLRYFGSTLPSL